MRLFGLYALCAVLVALAGCGNGGELSREQYVAKLDAACADFAAREAEIGEPKTVADLVEHGAQIVAAFEDTILATASTLIPPEAIADEAAKLADLARSQQAALRGLVDAAESGDLAKLQQLAARNRLINERSAKLARALGATTCA